MSRRPVVVDMHEGPRPIDACPACGASFAWVRRVDLREVAFDWRGADPRHPKTFEVRCRECHHVSVVFESERGVLSFVRDQAAALRHIRDRSRGDAASRFDDDD